MGGMAVVSVIGVVLIATSSKWEVLVLSGEGCSSVIVLRSHQIAAETPVLMS